MERTTRIIAGCLLAALLLAGTAAEAGMLDRLLKKDDGSHQAAPRYDRFPTIHYTVGRLVQSGMDGWKVDDYGLQLTPDCVITGADGEKGELIEGTEAIVSGALVNGVFVALRVRILDPSWSYGPRNPDVKVEWFESDPTVGIGTGPY